MMVYKELDTAIKYLKKWMKDEKVSTPFPALFPGKSYIHREPYGCVLIISPWNYPFQLLISPLIGAISAGNCAIIKPSEIASHTANIIGELINTHFPIHYISAILGDHEQTSELLNEKFDYIFFTGGTHIGKIIMQAAAKNLTPVTLELGGKSPCIVTADTNIDYAARRIVWAKFMNAGQTCIAPDYLYVDENIKTHLLDALKKYLNYFYGEDPLFSPDYGRIINAKHFARLTSLIDSNRLVVGGETDANVRYIAPTILDNISWHDPIMQDEIFGPLLPILTFKNIDEVITNINQHDKPLALYIFTLNKNIQHKILTQISFGGGCINDCLLQIANVNLPFGGVGGSGIGQYHGKYSFDTFSHAKGIYHKTWLFDIKLEYPPFSKWKLKWLRWLLK